MDMKNGGALPDGVGVLGGGGQKWKNWDNCNSIVDKSITKNKKKVNSWLRPRMIQ